MDYSTLSNSELIEHIELAEQERAERLALLGGAPAPERKGPGRPKGSTNAPKPPTQHGEATSPISTQ